MRSVRPGDGGASIATPPPAIQSVVEPRKGATGANSPQPVELRPGRLPATPPPSPAPGIPLPHLCVDMLPWRKNYLFCRPLVCFCHRFHVSVCGPGFGAMYWGLNSRFWQKSCSAACWRGALRLNAGAHHWMLLLSSVPLASDIFIFPMDWPTWLTPSLRGGMRSLMRSRPLASSKLVILCWGEKPRMAAGEVGQVRQTKSSSRVFFPWKKKIKPFPGVFLPRGSSSVGWSISERNKDTLFFFF